MTIEQDYARCRKLLIKLMCVCQTPNCRHAHHSKGDQHEYDVACPVESRYNKVMSDCDDFISETEN